MFTQCRNFQPSVYSKAVFRFFVFFISSFFVPACDNTLQIDLNIHSASHQGEDIHDAEVRVNGEFLGKTNEKGILLKKILAKAGQKLRLEVSKEDGENFYAPYVRTVEATEYKSASLDIQAVLYHIPKQEQDTPERQINSEGSDQGQDEESQITDSQDLSSSEKNRNEQLETLNPLSGEVGLEENQIAELENAANLADQLTEEDLDQFLNRDKKETQPKPNKSIELSNKKFVFEDSSYPKIKIEETKIEVAAKARMKKVTVSVKHQKRPIAGVLVHLGRKNQLDIKVVCKTNKKGICKFNYFVDSPNNATIFVKKKGYKSKTRRLGKKSKSKINISLEKGTSVDIYAITKHFNFTKGIKNVSVLANGKIVGLTNEYGHFSYDFNGKEDDLLEITLRSTNLLPSEYQTDFVVSDRLSLIKYFTPKQPPVIRLAIIEGNEINLNDARRKKQLLDQLKRSIQKHPLLSIVNSKLVKDIAKQKGKNISQLLKTGWSKTSMKSSIDGVLRIGMNSLGQVELNAIDSNGKQIAGSILETEVINAGTLKQASNKIINELVYNLPFEGSVVAQNGNYLTINWAQKHAMNLKVGQKVKIFGSQLNKMGNKISYVNIGTATIKKVLPRTVKAAVDQLSPRSSVTEGDLVTLHRNKLNVSAAYKQTANSRIAKNTLPVILVTDSSGKAIEGSSIYLSNRWIGATDKDGTFRFQRDLKGKSRKLMISKHGYEAKEIQRKIGIPIKIKLTRKMASLRVESHPSNAHIFIDDRKIGSTPLLKDFPIKKGFSKLRVSAGYPYKDFTQIVDIASNSIDLTGARQVELEKDYLKMAKDQIANGNYDSAIKLLNKIDKNHSSYLLSQHLLGEIALNYQDEVEDAIDYFERVVKVEKVASYADKQFIPSHINLALSYFKKGTKINYSNTDRYKAFVKAATILDRTKSHLRFLASGVYKKTVHEIYYYSALSKFKAFEIGHSTPLLEDAIRNWQTYLDSIVPLVEFSGAEYFRENSHIYLKQAKSYMMTNEKNKKM